MPTDMPHQQNSKTQTHARRPSGGESGQAVRQRRSREDMNAAGQKLREDARKAMSERRDRDEAQENLDRVERGDARFADVGSGTLLGYLLVGTLPFAVWLFDVLLLSQAAEYLIGLGSGLGSAVAKYGPFIISAGIIVIEMVLSRQRQAAKAEAIQYGQLARSEDRAAYRKWNVLSGVMALVMPILAGSAILARELPGAGLSGMSPKKWGLVVGAVLLALLLHGIMIYAGTWMHNARDYLLYRLRRWRHRRKARSKAESYEEAGSRAAEQLDTYQGTHDLCDRLHPNEEIPLGPFNAHIRTVVNEHYGFEYIPTPDGPGRDSAPTAPPAPEPSAPEAPGNPSADRPGLAPPFGSNGAPSGDGAMSPEPPSAEPNSPREDTQDGGDGSQAMADYYQGLAEAQRRDADGEVSL